MKAIDLSLVKRTVYTLLLLSVIAFLTGFLQSTAFEFVIYIFYFILLVGGIKLIMLTPKMTGSPKIFLLLTGFALTIYFLFFILALTNNIFHGADITQMMESFEGILYFVSLLALIGFIGSLISLRGK